jgi:cytochrome c biogenesis protein CcmG/thiol:disulfide interchange protein DsbE
MLMLRRTRVGLLMGLAFVLVSGCERGDHPGQIGKIAPQFVVTDAQRTVDLSKLRGKVVVLNFWASWCAPCTEELPSLESMQHSLPQVTVLAVSTDEDTSAYRNYLLQHHVDLLTVQDAAQTSNPLYGTFRYPETYVIDKNGMVRRKFIGPQDFTAPDVVDYLKKLAS